MNGWLIMAAIVSVALALLWLLRLRGPVFTLSVAALLFGATGYAVQGRPGLAGSPRTTADEAPAMPLAGARHAFFGTFTAAERWLILADSYARSGDTMGAVQTTQAAVRAHPDDAELWVGFGNAFVDHDGALTPAARFAYFRAIELAPNSPGPRFFYALALLRSGDRDGALAEWRAILAKAPPTASWRPLVEGGINLAESSR